MEHDLWRWKLENGIPDDAFESLGSIMSTHAPDLCTSFSNGSTAPFVQQPSAVPGSLDHLSNIGQYSDGIWPTDADQSGLVPFEPGPYSTFHGFPSIGSTSNLTNAVEYLPRESSTSLDDTSTAPLPLQSEQNTALESNDPLPFMTGARVSDTAPCIKCWASKKKVLLEQLPRPIEDISFN